MSHTPAPWRERYDDDNCYLVEADGRWVATVGDVADALLIAAAPDLLAFAQMMLACYDSQDGGPCWCEHIKEPPCGRCMVVAALTKAGVA